MRVKQPDEELIKSPRFQKPRKRRDFLGLAAVWSMLSAFAFSLFGAMRLPMPSVFPESNSKVKIGPPDKFPRGSETHFPSLNMWIFHHEQGFYAISTVCTHLGCIVTRQTHGGFNCPCHGSIFDPLGKVIGGPAPKGLDWLEVSLSSDGQLVVDRVQTVPFGSRVSLV